MITTHVYQIYIRAEIEDVFNALLDPAFTRKFFHGTAFAEPPQAGKPYLSVLPDGAAAVDGVIEVLEPPHRLVQTWHTRYDPALEAEPASRVEWLLSRAGDGLTLLRLVHGDLAFSPLTWANVKDGWVFILDSLKSLLETGTALPPKQTDTAAADSAPVSDADWHRRQGIEANNAVRPLLDGARTGDAAASAQAVETAYAAAYHWRRARGAGPANQARAQYMIALAWLGADQPGSALTAADACLAICDEHGLVDFDLAYAHEMRARALLAQGDLDAAEAAYRAAVAVPIADDEDRVIVDDDFADLAAHWPNLVRA